MKATYQISCTSDIYITIPNSSKITVVKQQHKVLLRGVTTCGTALKGHARHWALGRLRMAALEPRESLREGLRSCSPPVSQSGYFRRREAPSGGSAFCPGSEAWPVWKRSSHTCIPSLLLVFKDRVSIWHLSWPGTGYVVQASAAINAESPRLAPYLSLLLTLNVMTTSPKWWTVTWN